MEQRKGQEKWKSISPKSSQALRSPQVQPKIEDFEVFKSKVKILL